MEAEVLERTNGHATKKRAVFMDRMLPEQIADNWPILRRYVQKVLPVPAQTNYRAFVNAARTLFSGVADLWLLQTEEELLAVVITSLYVDPLVWSKHLMLYGLSIEGRITKEEAEQALFTLQRYADGLGCSNIIGFTSEKVITNMVENAGGSADFFLLELPLNSTFRR